MLRQGSTGLLRRALQFGLQQPVQQQQVCVQLQVLSLQAVRCRSKPSHPKNRNQDTRADKNAYIRQRAVERSLELQGHAATAAAAAAGGDVPHISSDAVGPAAAEAADGSSAAPRPTSTAAAAAAAVSEGGDSASSSSSSSASASSSDSSSGTEQKGWGPSWLRHFFGDSHKRRSGPPPVKASPLTPSSATRGLSDKEEQDRKLEQGKRYKETNRKPDADDGDAPAAPDDGWERLEDYKDLSMDDYAASIRNDPKSDDFEAPPRPMTPLRGARAYYGQAFDHARVMYSRYEIQNSIISILPQEDKLRVKLNPTIYRDQAVLHELADKCGYSVDAVRDVIVTFHKRRRGLQLMYKHRQAGGKLPPSNDDAAVEACLRRLRLQDDQDKLRRLLVERDAESCSLKRSESFATNIKAHMKRICPQTQLPYRECCGRKNKLNLGAKLKQKRLLQQAL